MPFLRPTFEPFATNFTLTGQTTGTTNQPTTFTVTPNRIVGGLVTVIPVASNGGSVAPASLIFTNSAVAQTFTVTRSTDGISSVSISNDGGLSNLGSPISFTTTTSAVNTNLLADWVTRSTAIGVVQAIRFNLAATVTNNRHIDGQQANVVQNASGGIIGDGSLRINFPAALGSNPGAFRVPLNASWNSDGQGFGATEHYLSYRFKPGANFLRQSNGGGGNKVSILGEYKFSSPNSSASHTSCEVVVNNQNWRQIPFAYREHPISGTTGFDVDNGDGVGIHLQPGIDRGAAATDNDQRYGLWNNGPASPGCYFWKEEHWHEIYIRLKIVDYGGAGTGNQIDIWVSRDDDAARVLIFNNRNFRIGSDSLVPLGNNAFWATLYDTNRTDAGFDTFGEWDQLIVSTQAIARPIPVTVTPTWRVGVAAGQWVQLANTAINSVDPSPSAAGTVSEKVHAWNSMTFNAGKSTGYSIANGGHTDYSGNEADAINFEANAPVWAQILAPSQLSPGDAPSGYYSDGKPMSRHSYQRHTFNEFEQNAMMFGGSRWNAGNIDGPVSALRLSDNTYLPSGSFPGLPSALNAGTCYSLPFCADERNGYVYAFGNFAVCRLNRNKGTWTTVTTGAPAYGNGTNSAFDTTRNRILLFGGIDSTIYQHTFSPDSNTFTSITLTGASASAVMNIREGSVAYVPALDVYLVRDGASGGTVYQINASTFATTVYSTSGGASIPAAFSAAGLYKKFFYSRRLGGVCLVAHTHTGNAWFLATESR